MHRWSSFIVNGALQVYVCMYVCIALCCRAQKRRRKATIACSLLWVKPEKTLLANSNITESESPCSNNQ